MWFAFVVQVRLLSLLQVGPRNDGADDRLPQVPHHLAHHVDFRHRGLGSVVQSHRKLMYQTMGQEVGPWHSCWEVPTDYGDVMQAEWEHS